MKVVKLTLPDASKATLALPSPGKIPAVHEVAPGNHAGCLPIPDPQKSLKNWDKIDDGKVKPGGGHGRRQTFPMVGLRGLS